MPWGWIGAALAVLLLLPVAFLVVYRARFGFHPFVVVFGSAAILLLVAPIALLALAHAAPHARRRGNAGAWLIGGLAALLAVAVAFILAGAALSNALWGDTLNARGWSSPSRATSTRFWISCRWPRTNGGVSS